MVDENVLLKMASKRLSTNEVIDAIFADQDSEYEVSEESESESDSTNSSEADEESNEVNEEVITPAVTVVRGQPRRVRTRGGRQNATGVTRDQQKNKKDEEKARKEAEKENRWKREDKEVNVPDFTGESKINVPLPEDPNLLDFVELFLDDDFFNLLVTQTNLYHAQYREAHTILPRHSRARQWKDVTVSEMKQFIALYLLTGVVRKPEISQYWSTDSLLKTPIFGEIMSRNRFQTILEFLHFNDNANYDANDPNRDRLFKVRPLVEHLVERFKTVYTPDKNIAVDEELLLWKGRLGFKQYIPNKRSRFGIKMFSICEASGYLWNSFVYLGKEANLSDVDKQLEKDLGKSGAVVPKLISNLFGLGYHLYVDNWYTSEALFRYLAANGTVACGTARANRISIPKSLKQEVLAKGQHAFRRDDNLLMIRYNDKKEIYFLSTIHQATTGNSKKKARDGTLVKKPTVVNEYNKYMGGIDRNDAMVGNYSSVRKSFKWTTKVAFHFIEEAVLNAFILVGKVKESNKARFMQFKLDVIREMLDKEIAKEANVFNLPLVGRHFLQLIPPTEKKQNPQKRCVVCYSKKIRKESRYRCKNCSDKPGLCPAPCFEEYHT